MSGTSLSWSLGAQKVEVMPKLLSLEEALREQVWTKDPGPPAGTLLLTNVSGAQGGRGALEEPGEGNGLLGLGREHPLLPFQLREAVS